MDPNKPLWMQSGTRAVNLARCTPLEFIRAHCEVLRKELMKSMGAKPEWFQIEILELLFESDQRDGVPVDRISAAMYDGLLLKGARTRCGNRPARAQYVCPYPDRDVDQQESVCDGMASLSLGPALKAQFMASVGDTEQGLIPFEDGITGNGNSKADHQD
eukprot:905949-Rhodomonas_salina.2